MRSLDLRRWFVCGLLSWLIAVPAFAVGLRVTSAKLEANPQRLVVELVNDGPAAVTAWGIDIVVSRQGCEDIHTGISEDLLNVIVNNRAASAMDQRTNKPAVDPWTGAIAPGASYEKILPMDIPEMKAANSVPTVKVTVVEAAYADGKVDAVGSDGVRRVREMQENRAAEARTESEASAIFTKYADDSDASHRIEEIRRAMMAAINQMPKSGGSDEIGSAELQNDLTNLEFFQKLGKPQVALDGYTALLVDRHKVRMELLTAMKE